MFFHNINIDVESDEIKIPTMKGDDFWKGIDEICCWLKNLPPIEDQEYKDAILAVERIMDWKSKFIDKTSPGERLLDSVFKDAVMYAYKHGMPK